ncbi:MAG: ABC transporter ATP-binding protein [Chloroflexota bacterium]|nr:ABC transporter ATP-binding protein [Chloroflexota bacterium]MDE2896551.1 ABC transporter ATP-binding protein [Chloroflexota bacterium]
MACAPDHDRQAPALQVQRVSKSFGETVAVSEASFDVARGEIVALLGPSGCGKTTTLRVLAGFEQPDEGIVLIDGETAVDETVWRPPERRRIGMVPQDFALFPHTSVADNIAFGLPHGHRAWWTRPWRRLRRVDPPPRVQELLELVGLHGFGDRFPHELSGGEAQRVALARALAPEPAAVLLDEPFSNLDQNLRASLRLAMRRILKAADTAAVFVTHDREEALSLADRVAVMREGRIEQIGAPDDIYYRPETRFIGSFVGDANILPATSFRHGAETELGFVILLNPSEGEDGRPLDVLLRPEQLALKIAEADDAEAARVINSEYYGHDQVVRVRLPSGLQVETRLRTEVVWQPDDPVQVVVLDDAIGFAR